MFASRTNWNLKTNRLADALERHRAGGRKLLDLAASNPTECGFKYDSPSIIRALCNPLALQYRPEPRGLLSARKAVSDYYASRGDQVNTEDLFLTVSTSEAFSHVFRLLCNPGDEVLIPTPSYPLFDFLADVNDVKLVRYPLLYDYGWQIDFASFEKAITPRARAAIVVHPNNPTGQYAKPREQAQLSAICTQQGLALIADEVFLDFSIERSSANSFVAQTNALAFALGGISKLCGLPQMKSAWIALSGPQKLKNGARQRLEVIADSYLSMNAPVQHALPAFLATRSQFESQLLLRVRANLVFLDQEIAKQRTCSRLVFDAGWNVVLRVPATRSDEDLTLGLLERHGVLVHPGHFYDFSHDGFLILSLIVAEKEFAEGVQSLLTFFSC